MAKENLNVNGEVEECTVVPIVGDGACLFHALSYLKYGTQDRAMEVRSEVVKYVVNDWSKVLIMNHDRNGNNYLTPDKYFANMMKNATYGGFCELIATGLIFPFKFEVYSNGLIYTESGSNDYPVRRLRFSQDLSSGHFDAYLPIAAQKITLRRMEVAVEEHDFGMDTPSQFKVDKGFQEVTVLEREHSPYLQ